jgi:hypothetical protein
LLVFVLKTRAVPGGGDAAASVNELSVGSQQVDDSVQYNVVQA